MMRPMVKPAVLAAGTLAAVALSLSGCSPDQPASTTPGTTPPVWTGSTAPSTAGGHGGHGGEQPIPSGEKLNATLKLADGTPVACDGCIDELARGWEPTCVRACPMRALAYRPYDPEDYAGREPDLAWEDHGLRPRVVYLRRRAES